MYEASNAKAGTAGRMYLVFFSLGIDSPTSTTKAQTAKCLKSLLSLPSRVPTQGRTQTTTTSTARGYAIA
jgi:hypothetical protein